MSNSPPLNHVDFGCGYPSARQFIEMALPNMSAVSFGSCSQRGGTINVFITEKNTVNTYDIITLLSLLQVDTFDNEHMCSAVKLWRRLQIYLEQVIHLCNSLWLPNSWRSMCSGHYVLPKYP